MEQAILAIGLLIVASGMFTAAFERTRLPDVLPLMVLGLLLGPVAGLVEVADFGKSGSVLSVIALVVILFEGGASTDLATLSRSAKPTLRLTLITFAVTFGLAPFSPDSAAPPVPVPDDRLAPSVGGDS